jgi:hypothetical protein
VNARIVHWLFSTMLVVGCSIGGSPADTRSDLESRASNAAVQGEAVSKFSKFDGRLRARCSPDRERT